MTRFTAVAAISVLVFAAYPATAQTNQASLSFDPAELATTEGAQVVYERIKVNAKRACEAKSLLLQRYQLRCRRDLAGQLVAQIQDPILLAIHDADQPVMRMARSD